MDKELSKYLVNYFSDLLTAKEKLGLKHLMSEFKIEHSDNKESIERKVALFKRIGWLTEDREILDMVSGGQDALDEKIAKRILSEHQDKVFINNCPNCGRLARTPFAKQCRHCGQSWR